MLTESSPSALSKARGIAMPSKILASPGKIRRDVVVFTSTFLEELLQILSLGSSVARKQRASRKHIIPPPMYSF